MMENGLAGLTPVQLFATLGLGGGLLSAALAGFLAWVVCYCRRVRRPPQANLPTPPVAPADLVQAALADERVLLALAKVLSPAIERMLDGRGDSPSPAMRQPVWTPPALPPPQSARMPPAPPLREPGHSGPVVHV